MGGSAWNVPVDWIWGIVFTVRFLSLVLRMRRVITGRHGINVKPVICLGYVSVNLAWCEVMHVCSLFYLHISPPG